MTCRKSINVRICFEPRRKIYFAVNHEPQYILNTVECFYPTVSSTFPHPLPIRISIFDCASDFVDEFRISDCDLEVWILHISREPIQVLSHNHLNGMYSRLMLSNLRFQECLVLFAILGCKRIRGCNVKVVKEIGNVKHNRVARLHSISTSSLS
jgi:hypothetical protein